MEKKLTPLAEAIEGLKAELSRLQSMSEIDQFDSGCISTIERDIEFLTEFLPKEQKEIESAHYKGQIRADDALISKGKATEYFNRIYK